MRAAQSTDFSVDVENIGRFTFARRKMGDVGKIRSRYNVMTEGNYTPEGYIADMTSWAIVTLQTLTVAQPDSFNIDNLDPLEDPDCEKKVTSIYNALRNMEDSFRPKPAQASEVAGEGVSA
jgi:hypothetical protein